MVQCLAWFSVQILLRPHLLDYLIERQIPLTICPLSNVKLKVFDSMERHNLKKLLNLGLCVTVNSDDPAYFGGYITENYQAAADALKLSHSEIYQLAKNSFRASFIAPEAQDALIAELDSFVGQL